MKLVTMDMETFKTIVRYAALRGMNHGNTNNVQKDLKDGYIIAEHEINQYLDRIEIKEG